MQLTLRNRGDRLSVAVHEEGRNRFTVELGGRCCEVEAELVSPSTLYIKIDGRNHIARVARIGEDHHVVIDGVLYVFSPESGSAAEEHGGTLAPPQILAPMPGKVLQVLVREGQEIAEGDGLLILEAMKMENRIVAEAPARVVRVHVTDGQMVEGGMVLLELEYLSAGT